jgi:flavin-dependent dehydrogenase
MDNKIRKILIVGGGTAGWMTALFLDRIINVPKEKFCEITLIESTSVGIIGVGEATVYGLLNFLNFLGINEYEFLANCDGSFKLGIKFVNWLHGKNEVYWHPFTGMPPTVGEFSAFDIWLNKKFKDEKTEDYSRLYLNPFLCDLNKGPKQLNENRPFLGETAYAYHFNTDLVGKYLGKIARERGVKHLTDIAGVTDVTFDENGYIESVKTGENGEISADFFVDCSGFKGLLINKAYQEPFIYYTDSLLNESAVAVRLPEDKYPNGMPSYTKATAMKYGWTWDIPLYSRRGIGYVYSGKFISKEEAERELMEDYLGLKVGDLVPNHIKMRVGKTRNLWVKNCLSIGLSGGFIEPLESTGIALITTGLMKIFANFPDKTFNPKLIESYNDYMTKYYESIRDFLVLHYCTTQREDTEYWKTARYGLNIPDSLTNDLSLYKENRLGFEESSSSLIRAFNTNSYSFILTGMNKYPDKVLPLLAYRDIKLYEKQLDEAVQQFIKGNHLLKTLPGHYEYLSHLHRTFQVKN